MNWYKRSNSKGMVLYHGTGSEFDQFDIGKYKTVQTGDWGKGVYFTPSVETANYYRQEANKVLNRELQDIYRQYEEETKNMKVINGSPQYSEKAIALLRKFQEMSRNINEDDQSGRVIKVVLDQGAKISKHYVYPDSTTDPFLADRLKDEGYDAVEIYDASTHGGSDLSEVVVMNTGIIRQVS